MSLFSATGDVGPVEIRLVGDIGASEVFVESLLMAGTGGGMPNLIPPNFAIRAAIPAFRAFSSSSVVSVASGISLLAAIGDVVTGDLVTTGEPAALSADTPSQTLCFDSRGAFTGDLAVSLGTTGNPV